MRTIHDDRPLRVCALGAEAAASDDAWDRFVDAAPDGTAFHRIAWMRAVEGAFGHAPCYLAALDGDAIRGVLPLFDVRGIRSGRVLLSVPHAPYGGICGTDRGARTVLLDAARRLGERLGVRYVEVRQLFHPSPELPTSTPFVTFVKTLEAEPDANFRAIPSKRRNMIRKGMQLGLEAHDGWEHLAPFYELYAVHRRGLGAPPFPWRFFEALRDRFGSAAGLLTVRNGGALVGGVVFLRHGDRVMPHFSAWLPDARALSVSDFMYWELMRTAALAGCRVFDFGQSHEGSGNYAFKTLWGFTPEPIAHQYVLVRDREAPSTAPANGSALVEAWKRLPLPLTKWLGPSVIRWLPLY